MGVVVITGCSTGFGYEAALAFGRRGDRVYAGMRNTSKGDLAKVISDEGIDAEVIAAPRRLRRQRARRDRFRCSSARARWTSS